MLVSEAFVLLVGHAMDGAMGRAGHAMASFTVDVVPHFDNAISLGAIWVSWIFRVELLWLLHAARPTHYFVVFHVDLSTEIWLDRSSASFLVLRLHV